MRHLPWMYRGKTEESPRSQKTTYVDPIEIKKLREEIQILKDREREHKVDLSKLKADLKDQRKKNKDLRDKVKTSTSQKPPKKVVKTTKTTEST